MMPAGTCGPPDIVHSFFGRAACAPHTANIGERRGGCPHPAHPNIPISPTGPGRGAPVQSLVTVAFEMVTAFLGAPSWLPPVTPALATAFTVFSPAASMVPNGV